MGSCILIVVDCTVLVVDATVCEFCYYILYMNSSL